MAEQVSSAPQPDSPTKGKVTRKRFIKLFGSWVGATTVLALTPKLAEAPVSPTVNNTQEPKKPKVEEEDAVELWRDKGVTVWRQKKDGKPIKWQDNRGKQGVFDSDMLEAKRVEALADRRVAPASINIVSSTDRSEEWLPEAKRKEVIITDKPSDIVSPEDLQLKGIEIINSDRVALHIRAEAFEADGLLADFAGGDNKLAIVVIDSPTINPFALTDKRYDPYRGIFSIMFNNTRLAYNTDTITPDSIRQYWIQAISRTVKSWDKNDPEYLLYEKWLLTWNSITDETVVKYGLGNFDTGYALEKDFYGPDLPDRNVVFVPIGGRPRYVDALEVSVDSVGKYLLKVKREEASGIGLFYEKPDLVAVQSFPKRSDFTDTEEYQKYGSGKLRGVVKGEDRRPGLVVRHEISHVVKYLHPDKDRRDTYSESLTDLLALDTIKRAEQRLKEEGDDRGYYFVLENIKDKYFVLT